MTNKIAAQKIASQTKIAAAALKQMKAAEATGDIKTAVVAASKLIEATDAAAEVSNYAGREYDALMQKLGCTKGERAGIAFWELPISDSVFNAYMTK